MAQHSDYSSDERGYGYGHGYGHDHGDDHDDNLSDDQHKVMQFALGDNTGSDESSQRFLGFVVVAILITLLFVLLNVPSFDRVMAFRIGDYNKRLATKAFIFLFIVIIFLWCVSLFQQDQASQQVQSDNDHDDCF